MELENYQDDYYLVPQHDLSPKTFTITQKLLDKLEAESGLNILGVQKS